MPGWWGAESEIRRSVAGGTSVIGALNPRAELVQLVGQAQPCSVPERSGHAPGSRRSLSEHEISQVTDSWNPHAAVALASFAKQGCTEWA